MIFRNQGGNLSSILCQIFHFSSVWADNLLTGHTSVASSISQAIQQLQQEWDQSHSMQPVSTSIGQIAGEGLPTVPGAADLNLDLLIPSTNDSGI